MAGEMRINLEALEAERRDLLRERERIERLFHDKAAQIRQLQIEMQQLNDGSTAAWTQSVVETKAEAKCEGCHRLEWRPFGAQRPLLCGTCEFSLGPETKADLLLQEHTITCIHDCGRRRVEGYFNCCAGRPRGTHSAACNSNKLQIMDKTFRLPPGQSKQPEPSLENSSEVAPPGQGRGAREVAAGDPSNGNPSNMDGRRIADNHIW